MTTTAKISNEEEVKKEEKGGQSQASGSKGVISTTHDIRNVLGKDDNVNFVKNVLDVNIATKWSYDAFPLQLILEVSAPASSPKRIDYIRIASENEQPYKLAFSNENIVTAYNKSGGNGTLKKGLNDIDVKNTVARYIQFEFPGNKELDEDKNQKPDPLGIYYVIVGQGEKGTGTLPVPTPVIEPGPPPVTEPTEGRIKDWGGDITKGAKSWKAVVMRDDTKLYKVVDAKGTNIADLFSTETSAKQFIAYHVQKQGDAAGPEPTKPEPTKPEPGPGPNPTPGGGDTVEGIKLPYKTTGKVRKDPYWNKRDDGLRLDYKGQKGTEFVNSIQVFYGGFKGDAPDDDITFKWSWGNHSGKGAEVRAYGIGLNNKNGKTRYRMEFYHPDYTSNLATGTGGVAIQKGKSFGYMGVKKTLPDGNILLEYYQDQGGLGADGKPSNNWKKVLSFVDKEYKVTDYSKNGCTGTTRIDDDKKGWENVDVKLSYFIEIQP